MASEEKSRAGGMAHSLTMFGRERLAVTGVTDVTTFDENAIAMETDEGTLTVRGRVIDRPMAVWFPAPATYTGEPMAEIHCHGSSDVLTETLTALFGSADSQ